MSDTPTANLQAHRNLNELAGVISRLVPGQSITISRHEMRRVGVPRGWSPADWIMENIIGSAYEFSYSETFGGDTTFARRREPLTVESGLQSYVSPDRIDSFRRRPDGLFEIV